MCHFAKRSTFSHSFPRQNRSAREIPTRIGSFRQRLGNAQIGRSPSVSERRAIRAKRDLRGHRIGGQDHPIVGQRELNMRNVFGRSVWRSAEVKVCNTGRLHDKPFGSGQFCQRLEHGETYR